MKAKSFKKLFVSLALSTILTFSGASSAFAATALLQPVALPDISQSVIITRMEGRY